jgi:hypothetical protein
MRPSYEALPSWLGGVPEVPPTPLRVYRVPQESALERALSNPRLPLHIGLVAVALGIGAAMASGSMRTESFATPRAEMSAYAEGKVAELRSFAPLSTRQGHGKSPLAAGGSLTTDLPGYSDVIEGTDGRRYYRRWDIDAAPTGSRRIKVRIVPATPLAGSESLDVTTIIPRPDQRG